MCAQQRPTMAGLQPLEAGHRGQLPNARLHNNPTLNMPKRRELSSPSIFAMHRAVVYPVMMNSRAYIFSFATAA